MKKLSASLRPIPLLALAGIAMMVFSLPVRLQAQTTDTYTNGAADNKYSTSGDWSGGTPNAASNVVISDSGTPLTVNYDPTTDTTTLSNTANALSINASTDAIALNFSTLFTIPTTPSATTTYYYYTTPAVSLTTSSTGSALITGNFGTSTGSPLLAPASTSFSTNVNLLDFDAQGGLTTSAAAGGTAGINITGLAINNSYTSSSSNKANAISVVTVGSGTGTTTAGLVTLGNTGGTDEFIVNAQSENNGTQSRPSYTALNLLSPTNGLLTIDNGGYFQTGYTGSTSTQIVPTGGTALAAGNNVINNIFVAVNGNVLIQNSVGSGAGTASFVVASTAAGTNPTSNQAEVEGTFTMTSGLLELEGNLGTTYNATSELVAFGDFNVTGGTIWAQTAGASIGLHDPLGSGTTVTGLNTIGSGVVFETGSTGATVASSANLSAAPLFNFLTGGGAATVGGTTEGLVDDQGLSSAVPLFNVQLGIYTDQTTGYIGTSTVVGTSSTVSQLQNFKMVRDTANASEGAGGNIGSLIFNEGNPTAPGYKATLLLGSDLTAYSTASLPITNYSDSQSIIDLNGWKLDLSLINGGTLWTPANSTNATSQTEWVFINSWNTSNGSTYDGFGATYANSTDEGIIAAGGFALAGSKSTSIVPYYVGPDVTLQATTGGLADNLSVYSTAAGGTVNGGYLGYIDPQSTFYYTGTGAASTLTTKQGATAFYTTIGALKVGDGTHASTLQFLSPITTGGSTTVNAASTIDLNGNNLTVSQVTGGIASPILTGTGTITNSGAAATIAFSGGAGLGPVNSTSLGTLTITPGTGVTLNLATAAVTFNLGASLASNQVVFTSASGAMISFSGNVINFNDVTGGSLTSGDYVLFSVVGGSASNYSGTYTIGTGLANSAYTGEQLQLVNTGSAEDLDLILTSTAAVPEPPTWTLVLAALALVAVWRRAFRRQAILTA